jgi:CheY-like chemotaxis protein
LGFADDVNAAQFDLPLLLMTNSLTLNPAAGLTASASSLHGTILLVEDDPTVREIVCQLIVSLGYKVFSATGAGDAVIEFRKHQECIDIVLTDLLMPPANGRELAEMICKISPRLKVIFMSGNLPETLPDGQTMNFLQKPFSRDELGCKLAEVMQQPPSGLPKATEDLALHLQPGPVR